MAEAQNLETNENTELAITLTGSDADNDPLTYTIVSQPINGSLIGSNDLYSYTPNNGYIGQDSISFKVNDGTEDSDEATIVIDVLASGNNAPVANNNSVNTTIDTEVVITLTGSDADSDPLTYSIIDQPTNGTLTGTDDTYTYTPNSGCSGQQFLEQVELLQIHV